VSYLWLLRLPLSLTVAVQMLLTRTSVLYGMDEFSTLAPQDAATVALETIWGKHPSDGRVNELMKEGIAQLHMGAHGLDGAHKTFDLIVKMSPSFAEGWNKLATVQYLLRMCDSGHGWGHAATSKLSIFRPRFRPHLHSCGLCSHLPASMMTGCLGRRCRNGSVWVTTPESCQTFHTK
jgi:hypothetical protein